MRARRKVLPHVDLGTLIVNAEGIGYAVRYGLTEPRANALDGIVVDDAFERLAEQGHSSPNVMSMRNHSESA